MKGIIVYYSRYGSTREYAEWISEETGFPVYNSDEKEIPVEENDVVVIGSPTLMSRPFMAKWIINNWNILKTKKVVLYSTSGIEPEDKALRKGLEEALSDEIRNNIEYFPLHGRVINKNLSMPHKMMMGIARMMEKDPVVRAGMKADVDGVARENIKELVSCIKS